MAGGKVSRSEPMPPTTRPSSCCLSAFCHAGDFRIVQQGTIRTGSVRSAHPRLDRSEHDRGHALIYLIPHSIQFSPRFTYVFCYTWIAWFVALYLLGRLKSRTRRTDYLPRQTVAKFLNLPHFHLGAGQNCSKMSALNAPAWNSKWILCHVLDVDRLNLYLHGQELLDATAIARVRPDSRPPSRTLPASIHSSGILVSTDGNSLSTNRSWRRRRRPRCSARRAIKSSTRKG